LARRAVFVHWKICPEPLEVPHLRVSFPFFLAGVAELADALDSKN
jgi:hypothetical protein